MPNPFAHALIAWQKRAGRHDLPWQQIGERTDPYRVWLAEIMLQQTQVAAVIPYYMRFLERFPTLTTLAVAPLDDVMQRWSGLGYYSRARNLHAAARRVVDDLGGAFPRDVRAIAGLPGIGRSTAAAIAVFAFGARAAILDGNVRRVLARVFAIEGVPSQKPVEKRLWALAETLVPDRNIAAYTQGLMDLGATVCTPARPNCAQCPFADACIAHIEDRIAELPRKRVRAALPERAITMLAVTHRGAVLLERRPPAGIWSGLWSLPEALALAAGGAEKARAFAERHGAIESVARLPSFVHGFTHFRLAVDVLRIELASCKDSSRASRVEAPNLDLRWLPCEQADRIGLPAPVRTLFESSLRYQGKASRSRGDGRVPS